MTENNVMAYCYQCRILQVFTLNKKGRYECKGELYSKCRWEANIVINGKTRYDIEPTTCGEPSSWVVRRKKQNKIYELDGERAKMFLIGHGDEYFYLNQFIRDMAIELEPEDNSKLTFNITVESTRDEDK